MPTALDSTARSAANQSDVSTDSISDFWLCTPGGEQALWCIVRYASSNWRARLTRNKLEGPWRNFEICALARGIIAHARCLRHPRRQSAGVAQCLPSEVEDASRVTASHSLACTRLAASASREFRVRPGATVPSAIQRLASAALFFAHSVVQRPIHQFLFPTWSAASTGPHQ